MVGGDDVVQGRAGGLEAEVSAADLPQQRVHLFEARVVQRAVFHRAHVVGRRQAGTAPGGYVDGVVGDVDGAVRQAVCRGDEGDLLAGVDGAGARVQQHLAHVHGQLDNLGDRTFVAQVDGSCRRDDG